MNHPEHNRNDGSPIMVGHFTLDEIKAMNREHDLRYGWSDNMSRVYTNPKSHPETYTGRLDDIWNRTQQ